MSIQEGTPIVRVNAINRSPNDKGIYEFVKDVIAEYYPETEWVHNPDLSNVLDIVNPKYWKWDGTAVVEMSQAEKDVVNDFILEEALADTGAESVSVSIRNDLPKSKLAGNPIAVHASYKPEIEGNTTYAIWSGAGDDMTDPVNGNGNGPLLNLQTTPGEAQTIVKIEFNPIYGRVWLHEAYIKFTGGGLQDSISSNICSYGVPLQQMVQKDLIVEETFIKYSPLGPGTGTHGFADPTKIVLIDRDFSSDGDWDYGEAGLVPNFTGTGRFKMSTEDQVVHCYVNRVPTFGSCSTYFSMSSDETTELLPGYYATVVLNNVSNTVWQASVLMEIYREMTYSP